MSARNGDKSRHHRLRKQRIARRQRWAKLVEAAKKPAKPAGKSA